MTKRIKSSLNAPYIEPDEFDAIASSLAQIDSFGVADECQMFPTRERIEFLLFAIGPVIEMAASGVKGLFNSRKRNAMLLGTYLLQAIQRKAEWRTTGDHFHLSKAHDALRLGAMAAMRGAGIRVGRDNESTCIIVYALLDAILALKEEGAAATEFHRVPEMAEGILRNMQEASMREHGLNLFKTAA